MPYGDGCEVTQLERGSSRNSFAIQEEARSFVNVVDQQGATEWMGGWWAEKILKYTELQGLFWCVLAQTRSFGQVDSGSFQLLAPAPLPNGCSWKPSFIFWQSLFLHTILHIFPSSSNTNHKNSFETIKSHPFPTCISFSTSRFRISTAQSRTTSL